MKPRFPDFLLLGAAKCGTTALASHLGQHPEILLSEPKEPYFFEKEFDLGLAYYWRRYFARWQGERLVGEARHRNLYLPYVAQRVHTVNPEARLLVILRNPVDRALSHWWHWYRGGEEPLWFEQAVAADIDRIQRGQRISSDREFSLQDCPLIGPYRTYIDSGYYAEQIERYLALFPREQLLVLLLEEFRADPTRSARQVVEFLGVDPDLLPAATRVRRNRARPLHWSRALLRPYPHVLRSLRSGGLRGRPRLSPETRRALEAHYRPHNDRLRALLDLDLACWVRADSGGGRG